MENEHWLTLDEVAESFQVSVPTIRRWIKAGRLPASKPGGVYRVRRRDFDEFVEESMGKAAASHSRDESPEERRLLAEIRPLTMLMDVQTRSWEKLAGGDVADADIQEVLDQRRQVLEAIEELLESLSEDGLLDWHNPAHRPSRRARLQLQGAFNRWTAAFYQVAEAQVGSMQSKPESAEERSVAAWFGDRVVA